MNKGTLKENLIYQGLYQVIRMMTPMITIPIVSRAFGPSGVGVSSFSFTIVQYFLMIASLGVQLYFNRLIAENDQSKRKLSQTFWNIFVSKALLSIVVLFCYLLMVFWFIDSYQLIFYLQGIFLIGAFFDISWYYAGVEKFKLPSLINMLMSFLVLIVVVCFVHDPSDLALYTFIIAAITVFNQIPLFFNLFREIEFTSIQWRQVGFIIKSSFAYFLPNGQLNLFTSLNCLVIGVSLTYKDVGIFSNTFNILTVAIILVNTIDLVMLPRLTKLTQNGHKSIKKILESNIHVQLLLTIPMVFGVIAIMPQFYIWFFGKSFYESVPLMTVLSILLVIIPLNMMMSRQYLLAKHRVASYNLSLIVGGLVNTILSFALIFPIGIYGIAVARIIAETIILIWRFVDIKKEGIIYHSASIVKSLISSCLMYIVIVFIVPYLHPPMLTTMIEIITGILIYLICNLMLKNEHLIFVLRSMLRKEKSI
ncbi:oligosaccharide flippase family protein [Staphylococcus simulans]|uniref:oligosaccharide flippase family protein n=1 Tax=Staphylococcus simulans TaxID=1286 RepID=UPI003F816A94